MTADVRRSPRRGTSSACATKRMHPTKAREIVASCSGTRPSLGPSTRARQSSLCSRRKTSGGGAFEATSRSGKPAQAGRTGTGVVTDGRSAARRVSPIPQGRGRDTSRKGRRSRPPSLRESWRARVWLPARRKRELQKSVGDVWSRISSANALRKERSGSSERGPRAERGSAGETVGERAARRDDRESTSPVRRERIGRRPRVTRDCHPAAFTSPKAVRRSRGRGCKGHRILRRVPIDGRHPGSSRSVGFHEQAWTVILAAFGALRPGRNLPKGGRPARWQHPRKWVRREGEPEIATGMSEVRSHRHRGKKTPTLVAECRKARVMRSVLDDDPPKRSQAP